MDVLIVKRRPMTASFKVEDGNLMMTIHHPDTMLSRENLGIWLPGNEEHIMRLFARAFAAGRENRTAEIKSAMSSL